MNQKESLQTIGMKHYKDFLIRLQTFDIQIKSRKSVNHGQHYEKNFYDISHENPFLGASFKNELKELKEHAITDVLNLPREQIIFQIQRL